MHLSSLRPDLQVLFMSGHADGGHPDTMEGEWSFLQKPFTVRALMSRIRELLPSRPDGPGASAAPGGDR